MLPQLQLQASESLQDPAAAPGAFAQDSTGFSMDPVLLVPSYLALPHERRRPLPC